MSASALVRPQNRGACPGLSAPMPTGDGLLVRLNPIGTIPLAAFSGLCAAAREHGNGVIEITSRGSIQVRGLNAATAPRFADAIAALGIAAEDGVPVLSNPLAGLDPEEIFNAGALAADLRQALAGGSLAAKLGAKVSVVVDGGGALSLANMPADVRLCAQATNGNAMLRIAVGGDDASATALVIVAPADGVAAATLLLEVIAKRGRDRRARDIIASEGIGVFRDTLSSASASYVRSETKGVDGRDKPGHDGQAIGLHRLRDGSLACGIGLAFGHADAGALKQLTRAAAAAVASGFRTAPGRVLMAIGLKPEAAGTFVAAAEELGFIVRAHDPRRHVVACAGAPICASAHIAARAIAPLIAASTATQFDGAFTIHISGCAKGCAHAAPVALTVVGTPEGCALVTDGSARDAPFAIVPTNELPAAIARFAIEREHGAGHV